MDIALQLEGLYPRAPATHATLAEVHFYLGQLEQAHFHLWLCQHFGGSLRGVMARTLLLLEDNDLQGALLQFEGRKMRKMPPRLIALLAESQRLAGYPEEAILILNQTRWKHSEHPLLLIAKLRSFYQLNQKAQWSEMYHRLEQLYGNSLLIQNELAKYPK